MTQTQTALFVPHGAPTCEWLSMRYRGEGASERFIWGATAGILRNLYRFLQATTTR